MRFNARLYKRIAVTASLSAVVMAPLTGCAQEPVDAGASPTGSIGVGSPTASPPGPRSTRPVTPSSNVDSKVIDGARELAVGACTVFDQSRMEVSNLPDAYVAAQALADRAAAADGSWRYLAVDIRTSHESFVRSEADPDSHDDFLRDQRDAVVLHDDCKALGVPLLDEHGYGTNEAQ